MAIFFFFLQSSCTKFSIVFAERTRDSSAKKPKDTSEAETNDGPFYFLFFNNIDKDGWRQSGSVQSPQSGVLMIPTLPCGLWCHTGFCLWMAMCSSPLISNRWWETSKWWSFTKTSSQNKVIGTQKNTTPTDHMTKKDYVFLITAGCAVGGPMLYCLLLCFVENLIWNLHHHGTGCISVLFARAAKRCPLHSSTFMISSRIQTISQNNKQKGSKECPKIICHPRGC